MDGLITWGYMTIVCSLDVVTNPCALEKVSTQRCITDIRTPKMYLCMEVIESCDNDCF